MCKTTDIDVKCILLFIACKKLYVSFTRHVEDWFGNRHLRPKCLFVI